MTISPARPTAERLKDLDQAYPEARIDFEMEETARLQFIAANPMQFDPHVVAAARQELQFRSDFQSKTAVTINFVDR